jgi:hypothetical protein
MYALNARVTYKNNTYQCLQAHTANSYWAPDVSPALWKIASGAPPAAAYYKICAQHSGRCLDGEITQKGDGARMQQWGYSNGDNQKWQIISLGDAYYKICAKYSGKCLDLDNGNQSNGAKVQLWTYAGGDHQRWAISPVGTSGTGELMGAWSASAYYPVGARVTYKNVTYEALQTHTANTYWAPDVSPSLWKVPQNTPMFSIVAKLGAKSIDVKDHNQADGAAIQQWAYLGESQQIWTITSVP